MINCVKVSKLGTIGIVGGLDLKVTFINLKVRQVLTKMEIQSFVKCMCIDYDGKFVGIS